jgi:hypothetical protein
MAAYRHWLSDRLIAGRMLRMQAWRPRYGYADRYEITETLKL